MKRFFIFYCLCFTSLLSYSQTFVKELGTARAQYENQVLNVSTGEFERTWLVSENGLVTTSIKSAGKDWVNVENTNCDWNYDGLIDKNSRAKLVSIQAGESNDEGFTSDHILVTAKFEYPKVETFVKYEIRVYPDAPGVFTQVSLKGQAGKYTSYKPPKPMIGFSLVQGRNFYNYWAHGNNPEYLVSYAIDDQKVEYLISGLDPLKKYRVGYTWSDVESKGRTQSITVTSVDGESRLEMVASQVLPKMEMVNNEDSRMWFALPSKVLLDGSFRLLVNNHSGPDALISEIWIMEEGDKIHQLHGNIDRIEELRTSIKNGWVLAAYLNCGEKRQTNAESATGRVDFIPVDATKFTRRYIGYYNDTQHRNKPETPLLKELVLDDPIQENENNSWSSILMVENGNDVLMVVKESNKCVNQYGHDTGNFYLSEDGIANMGTSLMPNEILPDRYRKAWASWLIAGKNGDDNRELLLKRFERFRFPVDPKRDIYIQANTWGSGSGKDGAKEENVLKEIEVQADLGIDIQQIDDGWQAEREWKPRNDWYPQNWKNVREGAENQGVKLGLWGAATPISLDALKWNYENGGFLSYKLDFASLGNYGSMEALIDKVRKFVLYTGQKVRVNWDVTENAPRFGYFWAKEYGSVYLENRKPDQPDNVIYIPHLVLRDLWHLSKYCNLNKFQGTVQNIDRVNTRVSDAYLHNHPYSVAIALMSTPLFFQETHLYTNEARAQIKPVLAAYKSVRNELYDCFVYPIGNEPDNKSWAGFQAHHPTKNIGYITLFRELNNMESKKTIQLRFLNDRKIRVTDLLTGKQLQLKTDENGFVEFEIRNNCDFRFYSYEYE